MSAGLRIQNITKRFPGVTALDDVSFEIAGGHCHALAGENGAGKSTLGKIIAGIYQPDGGAVILDGRPAAFRRPLEAARAGISMVHQELAFCPNLSVAENLLLGDPPSRCGCIAWREVERRARERMRSVGLDIDPWTPISELSTAQEQLVQIAAAIGRQARIIIMDEPTSSLSAGESARLFELIAELRGRGVTIIYVSHHLQEIMRLADKVTVLRDGRHVATKDIGELSADEIVRLMIGRNLQEVFPASGSVPEGPLLEVRDLSSEKVRGISLTIRAGEIVGLAGLVGAGRTELARAIFGIDPIETGEVRLEDRRVVIRDPSAAIRLGVGLLPEDRKRQGLVLSMGCRANVSLASLDRLSNGPWIDRRAERRLTTEILSLLKVRVSELDAPVENLSGGNQQKIVLAKWLARQCRVLILDESTRGIDIAAKAEIHRLILDLAARRHGVLLISSEMPELLSLSTRICVMAAGRIVSELPRSQATEESLMRLMAGLTDSQTLSAKTSFMREKNQ